MYLKLSLCLVFSFTGALNALATDNNQFRDILTSVLGEGNPDVDADAVIYGTPDTLTTEVFSPDASALANIQATDQAFIKYQPLDLYNTGVLQQGAQVSIDSINDKLESTPVTLVLVPGYLSEFAGAQFAAEEFSPDSILAKKWADALDAHRGEDVAMDSYYSLGDGNTLRASLGAVISAASVDGAQGSLFRMIAFRFPEEQTLESVGTIEEVAQIYNRRLEKTLALIGDDLGHLVFVGHSRGAAVALDMLAKGHAANKAWVKKVKAVVSYAGVITGSAAADRTDVAQSLDRENVLINRELQSSLRTGSSLNPFVLLANFRAFLRYKSANNVLKEKTTARLNKFFGSSEVHDSKYSGMDRIMDKLGDELNQSGGGTKAQKLKIFIGKTLAGLEGMRTGDRLNWWKENTLPVAGIKYYALAAAMTDPRRSALDRELVEQSPNYIVASDDFKIGLKSYRSMLLEPHTTTFNYDQAASLTDGNVAVQRTMFWPKLFASLNPANQIDSEFLGVLGVNHFALAHAKASDESEASPFARNAVLKAIAAKTAFDIAP